MTTRLTLGALLLVACHDLDAVPRIGEVDGATPRDLGPGPADLGDVDAAPVDLGAPRDTGVDAQTPDSGPAPLEEPYGASVSLNFPVRGAVPHADGILVVGRDDRDRGTEREALAAYFERTELSWAQSFGGAGNDQLLAVTAVSSTVAVAVGETRSVGAGGSDVLIAEFDDGSSSPSFAQVGTADNEAGFDVVAADGHLFIVGQQSSSPAVFRVPTTLDSAGSAARFDFGDDGRFFGVAVGMGRVAAVGVLGMDEVGIVAVLDATTLAVQWATTFRPPSGNIRLIDVAIAGDRLVAVGDAAGQAVRLEGQLDGMGAATVEQVGPADSRWFAQVAVVDGVERYAGTDGSNAFIGRREGDALVFDRLPFGFLAVEGRLAHFGSSPFLVANGASEPRTDIFVAPLNADGRAACATTESRDDFVTTTLTSARVTPSATSPELTGNTQPLSAADEARMGAATMCP